MTQDAIISRERSLSVMWLLLQPRPLASHTDSVSGLSTGFAVSVTEPPSDVADAAIPALPELNVGDHYAQNEGRSVVILCQTVAASVFRNVPFPISFC